LSGVAAVSAGGGHSLALKSDGTVWAWGYNTYGQLGIGTVSDTDRPFQVLQLHDVVAVSAGYRHSLAVLADGTVWAWGMNDGGELGNGGTLATKVPVQVQELRDVIAVRASDEVSLALKSDGTVWSWGGNDRGELGNGSNLESHVPIQVPGLSKVTAISMSFVTDGHSLALRADGTVWAWGYNASGQLGNGTTNNCNLPILAPGVQGVVALSAGGLHSLAVTAAGSSQAWSRTPPQP
jgi:alpha-tubulin suppressor-like RCC1 family protein